ncbi:MAG: hypothetical protein L6367_05915 [Cellulomonas sp.]|nr:hypothetical protein [Cellulomonas sp.]
MSTTVIDVAAYARAVRAELTGLGPEQVEDLTDGLEANLADALADEGRGIIGQDAEEVFGPPAEYARELLTAAGIAGPEPAPRRRRSVGQLLDTPFHAVARQGDRALARLRDVPGWSAVEDFLLVLRPAWWVLRAWVLWRILAVFGIGWSGALLPGSAVGLVALVVLLVGSVQWGRGRWRTHGGWHRVMLGVSVVAALAVPSVLGSAAQPRVVDGDDYVSAAPSDGVVVDGNEATNLFVYDGDGNPVERAQIYDQDGRPVLTASGGTGGYWSSADDQWRTFAPATSSGEARWNVFPLLSMPSTDLSVDGTGVEQWVTGGEPTATWPFAKAPLATAATSGPTASSDTQSTAVPNQTPSAGTAAPDASTEPGASETAAAPDPATAPEPAVEPGAAG